MGRALERQSTAGAWRLPDYPKFFARGRSGCAAPMPSAQPQRAICRTVKRRSLRLPRGHLLFFRILSIHDADTHALA